MSDFNVDSFNYEYAHKCYLAFYTNSGTSDMIAKGKEVSESDKWKSYIVKWQSEDSTLYVDDVDANGESTGMSQAAKKEINNLEKDGSAKSKKGGEAVAGAVGAPTAAAGAAMGLLAKTVGKAMGENGAVWAALIYLGIGIVFAITSELMRNQVKQNRELQERYVKKAEQDLAYNYADAQNKATAIHDLVSQQNEMQTQIQEQANANVGLSNAVADATTVSSVNTNMAALGTGDQVAGGAYDELTELNDEMLTTIGEYDVIMAEVNTNKSIVKVIDTDMPKFQQQRKNDKTTALIFAIGGFVAAAAGAMGIMAATANTVPWIIAVAILAYIGGMVAFGVPAALAMKESSNQSQALQKADETSKNAQQASNAASSASSDIRSKINESNTMYQNGQAMMEDFAEEDANHNGQPV